MKKRLSIFLGMLLTMCLCATAASAASPDTDNNGYHDGDEAIVNQLIDRSNLANQTLDKTTDEWSYTDTKGRQRIFAKWESDNTSNVRRIFLLRMYEQGLTGEVDVSDLTNMSILDLCNNPGIISIKLPESDCLSEVYADDTSISALDVTKCPNLSGISIENTHVTSIDISRNSKLASFLAKETPLSALNTTNNILLETLNLFKTPISSIDLSNNLNITGLLLSMPEVNWNGFKVRVENVQMYTSVSYDQHSDYFLICLNTKADDGFETDEFTGLPDDATISTLSDGYIEIEFSYYNGQNVDIALVYNPKTAPTPAPTPAPKSADGGMDMIYVDGTELAGFDRLVFNYTLDVPYEKTSVVFTGKMSHWGAWADNLWEIPLNVGANPVVIKTTAEDGQTNWFYTVTVNRAPEVVATPQPTVQPTPQPTEAPTPTPQPTAEATPTPTETPAPTPAPQTEDVGTQAKGVFNIWLIGMLALVVIVVIFLISRKRKND
ncbi:MAG: hypothetical protein IJW74_03740 [Oscillospiraceae bacterium]|nr:hypothetical protein [Oscillospiraceae bacterium]